MSRYATPEVVCLGWRVPLTARLLLAEPDPMAPDDLITVAVWAGPPAPYPELPTAREFQRAMDEWWLDRHRRLG